MKSRFRWLVFCCCCCSSNCCYLHTCCCLCCCCCGKFVQKLKMESCLRLAWRTGCCMLAIWRQHFICCNLLLQHNYMLWVFVECWPPRNVRNQFYFIYFEGILSLAHNALRKFYGDENFANKIFEIKNNIFKKISFKKIKTRNKLK